MRLLQYLLIWAFLIFAAAPMAQENEPQALLDSSLIDRDQFAAIVQFAEGKTTLVNSETSLDFKDIVKFGQELEVAANSKIKLITQKRCIAILYANTKLQSPKDKLSPWIVKSGSVRWICPEDKTESLTLLEAPIEIQNGEILFDKKFLIIFKDQVRSQSKDLKTQLTYSHVSGKLLPLKDQPTEADIWKRDQKFPLPKESIRWKADAPVNPSKFRVYLQPHIGIGGVHDWDKDRDITEQKFEVTGARLGVNFQIAEKHSVIAFLEFSEAENQDALDEMNGPAPIGYMSNRIESFIAAVGLRHNYIEPASLYYYAGLSRQTIDAFVKEDLLNDYKIRLEYKWNFVAALGYQYIFFPNSWFSLIAGVEGRIIQSLHKGSIKELRYPFGAEAVDPRGHFLNYSVNFYIGPSVNF